MSSGPVENGVFLLILAGMGLGWVNIGLALYTRSLAKRLDRLKKADLELEAKIRARLQQDTQVAQGLEDVTQDIDKILNEIAQHTKE